MPRLLKLLEEYVLETPPQDVDEDEEFEKIQLELSQKKLKQDPTLAVIPKFFKSQKVDPKDPIQRLYKQETRKLFLGNKSQLILDSGELDKMWELLLRNATPPIAEGDEKINYDGFLRVVESVPFQQKIREYINAELFMKFYKDEAGRISIPAFFNYVLRKVSLIQSRVQLSSYDADGDNYLTETDLESFVFDCIPKIMCLKRMKKSFQKHYVYTAVRKFMFFLDKHRRGKISIEDLISSNVLVEFNELQNEELTTEEEMNNWFSAASSLSVYDTFVKLDITKRGTLTQRDFARFNGGSLTSVFINRLFDEYPTQQGQMDYKMFLDFLLAYENRNTPMAIAYFWNILDYNKKGYMAPFDVNFFFREIIKRLGQSGADTVNIADVLEEIYSMVKPSGNPQHIILADLMSCKCGGTVVSMLIDVQAFWNYDNRESLMQQQP